MDVDSPAEIGALVAVFDVFQGIDYEPSPRLPDTERFNVSSLTTLSARELGVGQRQSSARRNAIMLWWSL